MMKKHIALLLTLLSCSLIVPNRASADVAVATIDTPWVAIGMPRVLHLEVTVPEGAQVAWTTAVQRRGFQAQDYQNPDTKYLLEFGPDTDFAIDTLRQDGNVTLRQNLLFYAFDSAAMVIPPFKFAVSGRDTVETQTLALKCENPFEEVPDDPQTLQDLKPVIDPEFVIWDYIWWMVWVLLAVAVIAAAWFGYQYYLHHRSNRPVELPKEKPLPPHVVALSALEALDGRKLWQEGRYKEYYTDLTDILRRYIEGRYKVSAMESTTDEILDGLVELTVTQKSSYNNLREVLNLADLVKFAKYEPLADENRMVFMNARLFVEQTKETVIEEEGQPQTPDNRPASDRNQAIGSKPASDHNQATGSKPASDNTKTASDNNKGEEA